ncbi:hypothetical protein [Hymenobacter armeniacus]|uniref:hypothetical protein n=1 Tax=Hymenobacter armeniacus TaxID=2771358 RepID=UPI00168507C3|nr:hypothetical protein [Hymenobacter armeniacus]
MLAALTVTATGFAACSKNETAPADPAPYSELKNYVMRPDGGGFVRTYNSPGIQSAAALGSKVLTLDFVASTANLHLEINRTQLKLRDSPLRGADWVGTYAWRCLDHPTDPVFVRYEFNSEGVTSAFPFSETTPQLTGNVTITAYDAKRHLISGQFVVEAPNQLNPLPFVVARFPLITMQVSGKFDNLKVVM